MNPFKICVGGSTIGLLQPQVALVVGVGDTSFIDATLHSYQRLVGGLLVCLL